MEADDCCVGSAELLFACLHLCLSICASVLWLEAVCVCVCVFLCVCIKGTGGRSLEKDVISAGSFPREPQLRTDCYISMFRYAAQITDIYRHLILHKHT